MAGRSASNLIQVRWAVRAVLFLGIAASITGNVLHALDNPISQAIAAWPPLALLLTVELISRVPVHRRAVAAARLVATATIAGIAGWVSYWHMTGVAARYGETGASPYLLPVSVDGLIVVASICLVELGGRIAEAARVQGPVRADKPAAEVARTPAPAESGPVRSEIADRPAPDPDRQATRKPRRTPKSSRAGLVRGPVRLVQSDRDEPDLAKLRQWRSDNEGRMPSLKQIEQTADCGRSKAIRLRDRLAATTNDRAAV